MTSAGRLSSSTSQGSPSRSSQASRPIAKPIAAPIAIEMTKAATTRASVTDIWNSNAPERASRSSRSNTAAGVGRLCGPAASAPICQHTSRIASESRRQSNPSSRSWACRTCRDRARRRRARELRAADRGERLEQHARVGLLLADRTARHAFGVAPAIERRRVGTRRADALHDLGPERGIARQRFLGLTRDGEELAERLGVPGREILVEDIADDRDRALGAQALLDVGDLDDPLESLAFEIDAKIPELQRRVEFALLRLLAEQRRRGEGDLRLVRDVEPVSLRIGLKQQPALVERPAGDAERPALEVGERGDWPVAPGHQRAERARIGRECQLAPERALARDPQPVGEDDVDRAARHRDLAGFRIGEVDDLADRAPPPCRARAP